MQCSSLAAMANREEKKRAGPYTDKAPERVPERVRAEMSDW